MLRSQFFHSTLTRPLDWSGEDLVAVKKFMPTSTWNIYLVCPTNHNHEGTWEAEGVINNTLNKLDEQFLEEPNYYEWCEDLWDDGIEAVYNYGFEIDPTCESGFVKLSTEGMTKTVSWERQSDGSFIMTDFEGRICRVESTGKVYEIFKSAEDLLWTVYSKQRDLCLDFYTHNQWTEAFKRLAEDLRANPNQLLPTVLWGNESIESRLPESLRVVYNHIISR